ncbi:MAG: hypothetical protein JNK78_16860 [Planctomycetes bacterium]|nr:hypothetical protein [Planctomycetota bacterium]
MAGQTDGAPNATHDVAPGSTETAPRTTPTAPPPAPLAEAPSNLPDAAPREANDGIDADRFASLLSLVRVRCSEDRFGEALVAVEQARALPLNPEQRTALQQANLAAADALRTALQRTVALVREGAVLEARRTLSTILADAAAPVRAEVGSSLMLAENAPDQALQALDRAANPRAAPAPTARPLARDRRVRTRWNGVDVVARVADSRSDEVTLRIEEGQGVTFPTVPVVACDPVEPTAAEAVEMGFAALHAGDALLARLWLSCAMQRGARDEDRAKRLAEVLR